MTNQQITQAAQQLKQYVIDCRRQMHRFAEPCGKEVKTSAWIRSQIEKIGLPYIAVGATGTLAILDSGRKGPHIALRADIDALPIKENPNNLVREKICVSENNGFCHACGHDTHTAMLLGSMKALVTLQENVCGTIYFCFEEGEETGTGIQPMLDTLSAYPIDTIWGIHVYSGLESGKISLPPGARMAGAAGINVTFTGKGGHGARPDLSVNPVFCAANFINNLAVAFANQISANENVTLGVTALKGGDSANIIPTTANVLGSMRFFNVEEGRKSVQILKQVAQNTAEMHRCSVEFSPDTQVLLGPVLNNTALAKAAESAIAEVLPQGAVTNCERWFASETFSKYLERYPGVFAFLGIQNEEYGSGAEHHNEKFDVDENVLHMGLIATLKYVAAFTLLSSRNKLVDKGALYPTTQGGIEVLWLADK